ncbi:MAG TPA: tRNA methyl transferase PRC-barrel domain-containing protein, partial [Candidatus Nanoarchaeia archaeon]|nr:tRNA methyl transferase PRC-barrel domain-containing protein [Candidatus Nanoarchaeia archaeon]
YFLYDLDQKTLSKTLFPIGNLKKEEVRKIAERHNFPNWDKPGTAGICFLGKTANIKSFLEKKIKEKRGKIISPEGKTLGTHPGIAYFTIGQKIQEHLGLKIKKPKEHAQERYYIAEKRKGIIVAAPEKHPYLLKEKIAITNFHQINPNEKIPDSGLTARVRHLGELYKGKLTKSKNNYTFTFSKPLQALAEGQSIVLNHKNRVIGGGKMKHLKT